jgi:MFS family permease
MAARDRLPPVTGLAVAKGAHFALSILLVMSTLSFLDRKVLSLLVEPIRHDLGINDFQFSLLQGAAFSIFYIALSLPVGWLVDRFSRRWIIYGGVTIWSAATIFTGLARSFPQMLLARSFVGAAEASLGPAAYSLLADVFPRRRQGFAIAVFSSGALIGGALAFALGGVLVRQFTRHPIPLPLIGHLSGWQEVLLAIGAAGVVLGPLVFSFREPPRAPSHHKDVADGQVWAYLRKRRAFYGLLCFGAGSQALISSAGALWAPAFMVRTYHWRIDQVGLTLALTTTTAALAGMIFAGVLVDRLFARGIRDAHLIVFSIYALVSTVSGIGGYLSPTAAGFLVLGTLHSATGGIGGLAAATLTVATPSEFRGRLSAMLTLMINLGTLGLAPTIVALFTDFVFHSDAKIGWSLAAVLAIFGPLAVVLLTLARKPMRDIIAAQDPMPLDAATSPIAGATASA